MEREEQVDLPFEVAFAFVFGFDLRLEQDCFRQGSGGRPGSTSDPYCVARGQPLVSRLMLIL
jgi:hypothetical protein